MECIFPPDSYNLKIASYYIIAVFFDFEFQ